MKKITLALAAAAVAALTMIPAGVTNARSCGGWGANNRLGEYAVVNHVHPERGMNCASSRYVVNRWLKRAYQRQWSNRLPTRFYDGYVTWHCGRTRGFSWRCHEHTSGTSFRFRAVYYG